MQKNFKNIETMLKRYARVYNKYQDELHKLDQDNDHSSEYKLRERNKLNETLRVTGEKAYEVVQADIEAIKESINKKNSSMDFLSDQEFTNALKVIELGNQSLSVDAIEALTNKFADNYQALTMLKSIYKEKEIFMEDSYLDKLISEHEYTVTGIDDLMYYSFKTDEPKIYNLVNSVSTLAEKRNCEFDSNVESYGGSGESSPLTFDQLVESF